MSNWKLLDDETRELAWDFVYDSLCFEPHNSPKFDSEFKKVSVSNYLNLMFIIALKSIYSIEAKNTLFTKQKCVKIFIPV